MFIKICGITRVHDAQHAVSEGATALGFVFWPQSPRAISPGAAAAITAALPSEMTTVGVFVNETVDAVRRVVEEAHLRAVQLHGDEAPSCAALVGRPVYRSVTIDDALDVARRWPPGTPLLLDASDPVRRGGTGRRVDWARAAVVARQYPVVLAGGLTPMNVEEAIAAVRPFGVDVSSGVESSPGIKDAEKVSSFVANARRAFGQW